MDLNHFRLFLKVAELGNISAAAKDLGMNQPALSRFISRLEDELGTPLFERHPKGVEPNAFGRILLHYARSIDANLQAVRRHIESSGKETVMIGAGYVWQRAPMTTALVNLSTAFPAVHVRIVSGVPKLLHAALAKGELDMVLGSTSRSEVYSQTLKAHALMELDMVVLVSRDHARGHDRTARVADLAEMRWVLPEGTLIRQHFEDVFEAHGIVPPLPHVSVNDVSTALEIAASSDLATLSSSTIIGDDLRRRLVQLPCPEVEILRNSGATLRRGEEPHRYCAALLDELRALISEGSWQPTR
ncbi:LysR family transcriptional regulator [Marinovum sp. 2_MG-2023]|uniref:LysR family transcriptional regulator n=1 Tax=unclassified Marinovum TaxID=2647166 RepID=UPI0026E36AF3|nr:MULTISPECIES: LysR family transcriptional regulator [unclassified Marinovum]MDO6732806.1 LysR family transcriptional regulator [Marinovum sp. 2_MG-2023]MDO6782075.1 LysR family transcriptional regulator [Marinovum sp. 1_MG-2023]